MADWVACHWPWGVGQRLGGRQEVDSIRKVSDPFEDVEGKSNSTRRRLCASGTQ